MNERIKQITGQVLDEIVPETWVALGYDKIKEIQNRTAELVIRECCIALAPMLRDMISRGQGVDMIKQHFGMNPNEITMAMLDTAIGQMETQLAEKMNNNKKYFEYLVALRDSGVTNMWGAAPYLQEYFGLGPKEARDILVQWIESFEK